MEHGLNKGSSRHSLAVGLLDESFTDILATRFRAGSNLIVSKQAIRDDVEALKYPYIPHKIPITDANLQISSELDPFS